MPDERTLVLPLSPGYVPTWGEFEVVREILQNAIDEDEQRGHKMAVVHDGERLFVGNTGANLRPDALLIGESDKSDRRLRGEHGEGLDLALLVAARMGRDMEVTTPDEVWTPRIEFNDDLGAQCLVIHMRPNVPRSDFVCVSLDVSATSWAKLRQRFTFISPPEDAVVTDKGTLILDLDRLGDIYVKGIWVTRRPEFPFGIDLPDVGLDRDRRLIQEFDLKWACGAVMAEALERDPSRFAARTYAMIEKKVPGADYVTSHVHHGTGAAEALTEQFRAKHGQDAVPCRNLDQSKQLHKVGRQGVLLDDGLASVIEKQAGTYYSVVEERRFLTERSYGWDELSPEEREVIEEASAAMRRATDHPAASLDIQLVDFIDPGIRGICNQGDGSIQVARNEAADFYGMLTTLVHEIAHAQTGAGDGSAEHGQRERELWCAVYRAERERAR